MASADLEAQHHPSHTATPAVALSPDQWKAFEKAYLTPPAAASKSPARPALANPTALGVASLTLTLFPLSINFLHWGTNSDPGALTLVPSCFFTSGIGLLLAAIGEFVCGNTFIFTVFGTLGGFTLSLGGQFDPVLNIAGAAVSGPGGQPLTGSAAAAAGVVYDSGMGIWLLSWSILLGIFTWMTLAINLVFFVIFLCVTCVLMMYGASFYCLAHGAVLIATRLITAAGAFAFVGSLLAFYLLTSMLNQSIGRAAFPVGDLSAGFPGLKRHVDSADTSDASATEVKEA